MKTNLLLVSLFDKGTKEIASKLAKEYDLYYAGDSKDVQATVNLSTGEITYTEVSL